MISHQSNMNNEWHCYYIWAQSWIQSTRLKNCKSLPSLLLRLVLCIILPYHCMSWCSRDPWYLRNDFHLLCDMNNEMNELHVWDPYPWDQLLSSIFSWHFGTVSKALRFYFHLALGFCFHLAFGFCSQGTWQCGISRIPSWILARHFLIEYSPLWVFLMSCWSTVHFLKQRPMTMWVATYTFSSRNGRLMRF